MTLPSSQEYFTFQPIEKVFESCFNPRKTFIEKKMKELTESILVKGILVPLLVRPMKDKPGFEIASGHRRLRAGIEAGLHEVPLIVKEMNDQDFLEVLIIENDKHEDLEPLEQALGYQTLMKEAKYDIPGIAHKISKSESYVYQRLKLLELIPEAQKNLLDGKITAGHAILIARLQPGGQITCLEAMKEEASYGEGGMSVRDLTDYIERNIHLDLNSASFKKNDPDLVPKAGPCTTCTKRTGFVPALFPEIKKKDTCTDPSCFNEKVEAFVEKWIKEKNESSDIPPLLLTTNYEYRMKNLPKDGIPIPANFYHEVKDRKKDLCSNAREGIIVEGTSVGKIETVCIDQDCKKHHPKYTPSPENDKWKRQRKVEEAKRRLNFKIRESILDATLSAWPGKLTREDLLLLAIEVYRPIWFEHQKRLLKRKGLTPKKEKYTNDAKEPMIAWLKSQKDKEIEKFLLECVLIQDIESHFGDKKPDVLFKTAARYKVDVKKIEREVRGKLKKTVQSLQSRKKNEKKKS